MSTAEVCLDITLNPANHSPCDVIKNEAEILDDSDWKLQFFSYLHVSVANS